VYKNKSNSSNNNPIPSNRLIIGRKPVIEALEAGKHIDKIFLLQSAEGNETQTIKKLCKERNIPLSYVPQEKLNRFTKANHQGIVALAALIEFLPLQDVIDQVVSNGETPFFIILDGVTDTRNLGAIARSAYCFGAHGLVIPISNNATITEDAVKTSAGALEKLLVSKVPSIQQAYDTLKLNGISIAATTLDHADYITKLDFTGPLAIVMGAEDKGVSPFASKHADHTIQIPMSKNFDSLNVAVASGVVCYEIYKQRNLS
jgi:23S rRNA (guanosine2251-2'-O)-methyltransferase